MAVAVAVAVAGAVAVAVTVAVAVAVAVAVTVAVGVGAAPTVADTSLEPGLSIVAVLYAVTTKKYVPFARFETVVVVVFPTSICWV